MTNNRACSKKNIDEKRFYNPICDRAFGNSHQLDAHLTTSTHLNEAAKS
jgi:hypothetical protein